MSGTAGWKLLGALALGIAAVSAIAGPTQAASQRSSLNIRQLNVVTTFTTAKFTVAANAATKLAINTGTDKVYMVSTPDRNELKHVVTVRGLAPNTNYYYSLVLTPKAGKARTVRGAFKTAAPGSSPATVTTRGNKLLLNGQPFFPVAAEIFDSCPTTPEVGLIAGLGAVILSVQGNTSATCSNQDPSTWASSLGSVLNGKFWWQENDSAAQQELQNENLKELLDWQANPALVGFSKTGSYLDAKQCFMASPEVYDMTSSVAKKRLTSLRSQPLVQYPFLGHPNTKTCVDQKNLSMSLWSFVAAGGSGILFSTQSSPATRYDVAKVISSGAVREVTKMKTLGPVFLVGSPAPVTSSSSSVREGAWSYGGNVYVVAINLSDSSTKATLKLAKSLNGTVRLMWERRNVRIFEGSFVDRFGPQGVHIYEVVIKK